MHSFLQGTAAALAQNGLMLLEDGSIVPQDSVVAAATAAVGGAGDAVEATAAGEAGMEHFLLSTCFKKCSRFRVKFDRRRNNFIGKSGVIAYG